jgi:hypothetical protein
MNIITRREKRSRHRGLLFIPLLAGIFTITAIILVNPVEYANSDFFSFWLSGRFAIIGQNPYQADIWIEAHDQFGASWISDERFLYPLPLSLFFIPLGFLSLYEAFIVWAILSQFMILLSAALLLRSYSATLRNHFLLPFFLGILLYRPTIITLHNGQVTALLLLMIACTVYFWEREKWWQGGVFLPVLALKPNLGVPIVLLFGLYLIRRGQTTALVSGVCSGLILLIAGLVQNPTWLLEFWRVGNTKLSQTFGFSPTVWGVSGFFCRYDLSCTIGYGGLIASLFLLGFVVLVIKKPGALSPALAASFIVTVVLLVTPYTWPYDQLLLLIPVITVTLRLARAGYRFLPTALILLILDTLAFIMLGISAMLEREFWNAIIPLSIFFLLVWYLFVKRQASSNTQPV